MADTTDTTTSETSDTDDQQARVEQSKSQRVTTIEFFREKFANEESGPDWIDPKGDCEETSKHHFIAGQTGGGKTTKLVGILDDEDEEVSS